MATPHGPAVPLNRRYERESWNTQVRRAMVLVMPQPPSLTPEQRAAALEKAALARKARAGLKDDLKSGRLTLKELLSKADKDEIVGKMKVISVLESLPGTGKVKAHRLMEQIGISESRRLQGLGAKQRESLLEAVHRP